MLNLDNYSHIKNVHILKNEQMIMQWEQIL